MPRHVEGKGNPFHPFKFHMKQKARYLPYQMKAIRENEENKRKVKEKRYRPRFMEQSKLASIPPAVWELKPPAITSLVYLLGIRKGDLVRVLHGKDQGRTGVILDINKATNQIIVEGCNMQNTFWNPKWSADRRIPSLVTVEAPIHVNNVVLLDPVTKQPTRVKKRIRMDGRPVRISKISGCAMPRPIRPPEIGDKDHFNYLDRPKTVPMADRYHNREKKYFQILSKIALESLPKT
eukprot:GHVL01022976.1.p1 GENE.GHVL01022976.1~~GHVL01022976.1.p1  ORF type:complete len:236 (+),score=34.29 GHVL01022976.1:42-749(+)